VNSVKLFKRKKNLLEGYLSEAPDIPKPLELIATYCGFGFSPLNVKVFSLCHPTV